MKLHNDPIPNDELELRRRLRQLPRERVPQRDLWAGIEARLEPAAAIPRRSPRRPWIVAAFAAAASLALALGVLLRPAPMQEPAAPLAGATAAEGMRPDTGAPPQAALVRREADAITIEYQSALALFAAAPLPPDLEAAASELDASAAQLRHALRAQPDATYLLDRLRHTYDQRLKLTQRAVLG